ncbi:MAG: GNAT family N-acetyltransferase [Planctomycetota bacterium]
MYFPISLIFYVSNKSLQAVISGGFPLLESEEPVFGSGERFKFTLKSVSDNTDLCEELDCITKSDTMSCVIVVSDELTTSSVEAGLVPSDLTRAIRQKFQEGIHLCGLVALAPGATRRILDIDRSVDTFAFNLEELKKAITKTANGLRLKAPPAHTKTLGDSYMIEIKAVQSRERLLECLKLRFQIYGLMGYLSDELASNPAELELDSFDLNSVHFVAVDHGNGQLAGTARLVVPQVTHHEKTLIGNPYQTVHQHGSWCNSIARMPGADVLRYKLQEPYLLSLPILQSSDFKDKWREMLDEANQGGEISRVVVSPKYRGLGVSTMLVRAAIATSYSIGKKFLLLECVPSHAKMYEKYGFKLIEGHHNRVQELDQVAVGMQLKLDDLPGNQAIQMAKCDIRMIQKGTKDDFMLAGTKHLCVCHNRKCWSQGEYKFYKQAGCPLRSQH